MTLLLRPHHKAYAKLLEYNIAKNKVVAQGLSEEHAEGLVKIMKAGDR